MSDQLQKLSAQIERMTIEFADLNYGHWKLTRRGCRGSRRSWLYTPKSPAIEKGIISLSEEIAKLQAMRSAMLAQRKAGP